MKILPIKNLKKITLILLFFPVILLSQENNSKEVLFIGNSFTFFWNMPQMLEAMAKDQGINLNTSQSTVGGSNLAQHWKEEKNTQTRKMLEEKPWDYIVLQDHSLSTIDDAEGFQSYTTNFIEFAREKEIRPLLSMTWAYNSNPLMQKTIEDSYLKLGEETNTNVVPVGTIFMKARKSRPDLNLYFDDKHPSPEGSYLIALVFYKYFTANSVLEMPNRLTTKDSEGNQLYLNFILPETGVFLRQLVEGFDMEPYKETN